LNFIDALKRLEKSSEFKEWKKKNPESYLAHGFIMGSKSEEREWQIGYYNPKTEKILTFVLSEEIMSNPESEIMNKKVKEIDLHKLKITVDEAFIEADKIQKEKYSMHLPLKK
jgi:hypothetical protein